jgi:hypothetical protein
MRRLTAMLILLTWGLWFGGVLMLFIAVLSVFAEFPNRPDLAGQAAAHVFRTFNRYQLALAAAALILTFIWYLLGPPRIKIGLFTLFALATCIACVITIYVAPEIERLRELQLTHSPEFNRMHGISMVAYLGEAALLLVAGGLLSWIGAGASAAPPNKR